MSQGLQFSILLSGSDTALKSDSAAADTDLAAQGLIFGEMLGDMVQPAKKGLGQAALRQLPAGISMLSGVSQAMLASDADISAEAVTQSDITLLAASLLGQIALKDKAPQDPTALATTEEASIADDSAASQPLLSDAAVKSSVSLLDTTDTVLAQADTAKPNNVAGHSGHNTDTQPSQSDNSQAIALSTLKQQLHQAKADIAAQEADKVDRPTAEQPAQRNVAGTEPNSPALSTADNKAEKNQHAGAAGITQPLSAELTDAELLAMGVNTEQAPDLAPATDNALQHDVSDKSSNSRQTITKPEQVAPDVAAAQQHTAASVKAPDQIAVSRGKTEPTTLAETKATSASQLQADKAASNAMADTGSASAKHGGSDQQAQQQSPRQNSASAQIADAQQLIPEAHVTGGKTNSDAATANRTDGMFASALHSAEVQQRQSVPGIAKTVAEQLQQNLNLQQQDAAGQLRERVSLMVRQNIQVAEIRLDPAGLGQMQIKIDMQQDQASVQFVVQQPQAKELLEQQLPRLRELLQQQGITLSEGNVQQQSQQQERQLAQRHSDGGNGRQSQGNTPADGDEGATVVQLTTRLSERLVDYYA